MTLIETATTADWTIAYGTIGLGIATVLIAAVAVFQDHIRRWLWHPNLIVSTANEPPDCLSMPLHNERTGAFASESVFLRLRISNLGNTPATHVEVFASLLLRKDKSGNWNRVPTFLPMNLCWADRRGEIYLPFIGPQAFRFCDLGRIADPATRSASGDENQKLGLKPTEASIPICDRYYAHSPWQHRWTW